MCIKKFFISPELIVIMGAFALYIKNPQWSNIIGEKITSESSLYYIYWAIPFGLLIYILKQFNVIMYPKDKRIYKWSGYKELKITMYISVIYSIIGIGCVIVSILSDFSNAVIGLLYLIGFGILFITSVTLFIAQGNQKEVLYSIPDNSE